MTWGVRNFVVAGVISVDFWVISAGELAPFLSSGVHCSQGES